MKTYKISILSLLLALLFLAGCSDRKKFFEDERYEKMVYIVSDNNNIHNLIYDLSLIHICYISRFTVENVCGKTGSGYNIGGDLASTTFEAWRLKVGCCDPEGNYYSCYSSFGNNGGLALISEKKNQSKKIISEMVNDVMYHNVTEKLYAVGKMCIRDRS